MKSYNVYKVNISHFDELSTNIYNMKNGFHHCKDVMHGQISVWLKIDLNLSKMKRKKKAILIYQIKYNMASIPLPRSFPLHLDLSILKLNYAIYLSL